MLIKIPRTLDEYGSDRLRTHILECQTFQNEESLERLRAKLNPKISNKLEFFRNPNSAVDSILDVYYGFPQEIDGLLGVIKSIEGDTNQYKRLYNVIFDIAQYQQEKWKEDEGNSSGKKTNGELSVDINYVSSDFEYSWSTLFDILEFINWEIIWEASRKTLSIRERNDWRNENILKSLCFTKNNELLKLFFIQENKPDILTGFANNLNRICKFTNQSIIDWLEGFQGQSDIKEESESIPVLIIVIDSDTTNDNWSVQAQLLVQGKPKSLLPQESDTKVFSCEEFDDIPEIIESFISDINNPEYPENIIIPQDLPIDELRIDELRIEVFLPISSLNLNFDCWAISSDESYNSLVEDNKLFLRSRERYTGSKRKRNEQKLKVGWTRLEQCAGDCSQELKIIELAKEIEKTEKDSEILKIIDQDRVDNWTALKNFIDKDCDRLWGIKLQDTLPEDLKVKGKFFNTIYSSGIPILFWHWDSISEKLLTSFENEFNACLCKQNLANRCSTFLDEIWRLRSDAWGYSDENQRKEAPGYYFGLLLEDPEIMFDEKTLKTHQGRK